MADVQSGKKKTNKRRKLGKYSKQFLRTGKNKQKARDKHALLHPKDEQARKLWELHPIKFS